MASTTMSSLKLAVASYDAAVRTYNENLSRKNMAIEAYKDAQRDWLSARAKKSVFAHVLSDMEREAFSDLLATVQIANQSLAAVDNAMRIIEGVRGRTNGVKNCKN